MKNDQTLQNLPILVISNSIPFPGMTNYLNLSQQGVEAINKASENPLNPYIVAVGQVAQNNKEGRLNTFGVLAKVSHIKQIQSGQFSVLVNYLERFKITDVKIGEKGTLDFCDGVIEKSIYTENAQVVANLTAQLSKELHDYATYTENRIEGNLLGELLNSMNGVSIELGIMVDNIVFNIVMDKSSKQVLLETLSVEERAKKLIAHMNSATTKSKIKVEIEEKSNNSLKEKYKKQVLQHKMNEIKKELGEGEDNSLNDLKQKLMKTKLPPEVAKTAMEEFNRLSLIHPSASEYNLIRNYLENWILEFPWYKRTKDELDITKARDTLEKDHYGLEKVKKQILEFVAVASLKKSLKGQIICLSGPPGVGKTTLARSIATALNRKYVRFSLGGIKDESEIRGHRRTYVGAMPGKIVQSLKKVGVNNPVILLDEIDKISSNNYNGDPSSALLEVLDPDQNISFLDNFLNLPVDLSNVLFIATSNYLQNIPAPLRDRLDIIELSGYTTTEKLTIAKKHLVPKQIKELGLNSEKIIFEDSALLKIIENYTREAGVRELDRKITAALRGLVEEVLQDKNKLINITEKLVREKLGSEIFSNKNIKPSGIGVSTGLAWTPVGGSVLYIETLAIPNGNGMVKLTGNLGDTMKESAQIAMSLLRANYNIKNLKETDIHIHIAAGAIKKDGPSAGITLLTALYSLTQNKNVPDDIAMTGELSLKGAVLPIGGLKEKILAAHRTGIIKRIIIPKDNSPDLEEIPKNIKDELKIFEVSDFTEVLDIVFNLKSTK